MKQIEDLEWLICRHICKAEYLPCANSQDVLFGYNGSVKPQGDVSILRLAGFTKMAQPGTPVILSSTLFKNL